MLLAKTFNLRDIYGFPGRNQIPPLDWPPNPSPTGLALFVQGRRRDVVSLGNYPVIHSSAKL